VRAGYYWSPQVTDLLRNKAQLAGIAMRCR